ncbi:hypothetical protein N9O29_00700 [Alphaproteobacteria bacterium]|nr:hypothetical protein [Alphaproteobacteria bacterium]MDB4233833.1 hypothetical protein [Alphaproteobacteria bacterium]
MKILILILSYVFLFSSHVRAEYEMHIPNCTQKGVENCGGFLFDNETGDVLFCGSDSCADLKLPKSWKNKVSEKQSKQDQIIEMLSNMQPGSVSSTSTSAKKEGTSEPKKDDKKKVETEEKPKKKKVEKCDKAKKSLCKASGGMQLGGSKIKKKKKTTD